MVEYKNPDDKEKSGRPKIITKIWNEKLKQEILESYKNGNSDIVAIAKLDISRETFYKLLRTDKEYLEPKEKDFIDTIKSGNILSQVWWEEKGKKGMIGEIDHFNNGAFVFQMKNRFKKGGFDGSWADRQDLEQNIKSDDGVPVVFNLKTEK